MNSYRILPFEPAYQPSIDRMMEEIQAEFSEVFTAADSFSITELASKKESAFWVVLLDEKVVGTIGLESFHPACGILKRMFIARAHRGEKNGLSQKLLHTALAEAGRREMTRIFLGTMQQFAGAQRFYLKNGFVRVSKRELPEGMKLSSLDTVFFRLNLPGQ